MPTQVIREKWGGELVDAGWTAIPNMLIMHAAELGLDSTDVHILAVICSCQWTADSNAYPSKRTIAAAIGKDPNTVRRRIQRMERDKLIERVERRSQTFRNTNIYLLDGLKAKLLPFAVAHKQKRATRIKWKGTAKSKLRVVPIAGGAA